MQLRLLPALTHIHTNEKSKLDHSQSGGPNRKFTREMKHFVAIWRIIEHIREQSLKLFWMSIISFVQKWN